MRWFVVVLALAIAGCSSDGDPTVEPSPTTIEPVDELLIELVPGCSDAKCRVLDRLDWLPSPKGPATLALVATTSDGHDASEQPVRVLVASEAGELLWLSPAGDRPTTVSTTDGTVADDVLEADAAGTVVLELAIGASSWTLAARARPDVMREIVVADGSSRTTYRWDGTDYAAPT